MTGRLLLVVGSNWGARPPLTYLPEAARALEHSLLHPQPGQCAPALPDGRSLLVDPTAAELDAAIEAAFASASAQEATLILAFTGHGVTVGEDFYLLAVDSPEVPDSRRAFLLGQRIKELLRRYPRVNGLLLLLDTCESGRAADVAGREWITVLRRAERRLELLTATGDGPAYGGCLVKSLAYLVRTGSESALDRIGFADVHGPVNELCTQQRATHTAFTGAGTGTGDVSLWLALNSAQARRRAALDGTVAADIAARFARFHQPTDAQRRVRAHLESGRSVGVVGPAGSGKTALLVALAQPVASPALHGIWLCEPGHSVEQVATELAGQLARTVDEYPRAARTYRAGATDEQWLRADAVERLLLGPLRSVACPVRIAIDGPTDEITVRLVGPLIRAEGVQLLVTAADVGGVPEGAEAVAVAPATREEIAGFAARRGLPGDVVDELARRSAGNWLTVRLLADVLARDPAGQLPGGLAGFYGAALEQASGGDLIDSREISVVLAVLAAAGSGPVLPLSLLRTACALLGGPGETWRLHEVVARLPALITHGRAGAGEERFGLLHPTIAGYLWEHRIGTVTPEQAHGALAAALAEVAPMGRHRHGDPQHDYAARAEPEHLWRVGRHGDAVRSLESRQSPIHAENRERWAAWARRIARELGATHPLAIVAEARHARAIAETGDHARALEMLVALAEDSRAELGATHRTTLGLADDIAFWTAESGRVDEARDRFAELVPVLVREFGESDPQTLMARHHLALMIAKTGDPDTALRRWAEILTARERVMGALHLDTLRTRHNILYWTAEKPTPPPVGSQFADLLATMRDTIGDQHPETLTVRYHAALFAAKTEDPTAIRQALADFAALLPEIEHAFGANSPWADRVREQLGFWPRYLAAREQA